MTVADDIAAEIASVRPKIFDAALPDDYEILRTELVRDDRGGWTETETSVETGRCRVGPRQVSSVEEPRGDVITGPTVYSALFPRETTLRTTDVVRINETRMNVRAVWRIGRFGIFTEAEVEVIV